jgi:hypothetical protein
MGCQIYGLCHSSEVQLGEANSSFSRIAPLSGENVTKLANVFQGLEEIHLGDSGMSWSEVGGFAIELTLDMFSWAIVPSD